MKNTSTEKKQNKNLKLALVSGTVLSSILIVTLLVTLIRYNHITWSGDIDKSLLGVIGDFLGGVIGTIFTIIATFLIWLTYNSQKNELAQTRVLVERQLEATHLPHFTIKKHIEKYTELAQITFADHNYGSYGYFNLELLNIGNEPAKEVTLEWDYFDSFDRRNEIIAKLNKIASKTTEKHIANLDYLESYRNSDAKYYAESDRNYDYILPITIHEEIKQNLNISIPYKLVIIFYELNRFLVKHLGRDGELDALGYVRISYKNSLNSPLVQEFRLNYIFKEEFVQGELREWIEVRAFEGAIGSKI